jgi:hypothetical protein
VRVSAEQPAITLPVQLWQPVSSVTLTCFCNTSGSPRQFVDSNCSTTCPLPTGAFEIVMLSDVELPVLGETNALQPLGRLCDAMVQVPLGRPTPGGQLTE